jgi:hypothetical protein
LGGLPLAHLLRVFWSGLRDSGALGSFLNAIFSRLFGHSGPSLANPISFLFIGYASKLMFDPSRSFFWIEVGPKRFLAGSYDVAERFGFQQFTMLDLTFRGPKVNVRLEVCRTFFGRHVAQTLTGCLRDQSFAFFMKTTVAAAA